jgi:hypothetical protein
VTTSAANRIERIGFLIMSSIRFYPILPFLWAVQGRKATPECPQGKVADGLPDDAAPVELRRVPIHGNDILRAEVPQQ